MGRDKGAQLTRAGRQGGRAGRQLCPGIAAAEDLSAVFVFGTDSLSVQGWAVEGRVEGPRVSPPCLLLCKNPEHSFLWVHRAQWHLLSFSLFLWALFNLKFAPSSVSYLIPPTGGKKKPNGSLWLLDLNDGIFPGLSSYGGQRPEFRTGSHSGLLCDPGKSPHL